jgi:hypothetical protein
MKPRPDPLERLRASHESLEALGIPHGLIGGWAVIAWGRVRATRDLDWLAIIPASRRKEVLASLASFGAAEWRAPGEDDPIAGLIRVVPADEEEAVLDILIAKGSADRTALSRCISVELGKSSLPAVRPEDIIAMKLQAGGGLDYEDARELLGVQAGRLDEAMLVAACKERRVLDRLALIRR